jgi:hypothetical protein
MIRLLAAGLSFFTLVFSIPLAFGQSKLPSSESKQILSNGLYQSEPHSQKAVLPDGTHTTLRNQRIFLKVFPGKKLAMITSEGSAEEIDKWLTEESDLVGDYDSVILDDTLVFYFGPTKHSVKSLSLGKALIRSEFANGVIDKHKLTLVIPSP